MPEQQSTHQKALALNLDASKYGAIAEIGAGQEVARWFFRVGGAAGTVAKTMSAYDMTVSDSIYGKSSRYVARDRLDAMLDTEYGGIIDRLAAKRGDETTFFAFADTVASRNYQGTNVCHGWMGLRFQREAGGAASTARLHIGMLDRTNERQQQAVGILGVNLIHAAYYHCGSHEEFLGSLLDGLSLERIEVDHLDLDGPAFDRFPNDLGMPLIRSGLARVVSWSPEVETLDPMSAIYGRPVVVERGSFAESSPSHEGLMKAALERLANEAVDSRRPPVGFYELSLANPAAPEPLSDQEAERRMAEMKEHGWPILLSNIPETFNFTTYLKRFTKEPIRFAIGLSNVVHVFHEAYYRELDGGVLGAFAQLLGADVKLYVLPQTVESLHEALAKLEGGAEMWSLPESGMAKLENTEPTTRLRHLYRYMRETGTLITLEEI
jgi:hypothetical protein